MSEHKLFIVSMTILPGAPGRRVAFDMWGIPIQWKVMKGTIYAKILARTKELPIHKDFYKDYHVEEFTGDYREIKRQYFSVIDGEINYLRRGGELGKKNILDAILLSMSVNRHIAWFRLFFPSQFKIEDFEELLWNKLVSLGHELPKVKLRLDLIGHWRDIQ